MRPATSHGAWEVVRPIVVIAVDAARLHTTADTRPASVSHSITISQSSPPAARHADTGNGTIGFSVRKHRTNKPLDMIRYCALSATVPQDPVGAVGHEYRCA